MSSVATRANRTSRRLTPVAKEMLSRGFVAPEQGTGVAGMITSRDMVADGAVECPAPAMAVDGSGGICPQMMLRTVADAEAVLKLEQAFADHGERPVTGLHLMMHAVARMLPRFQSLNGHWSAETGFVPAATVTIGVMRTDVPVAWRGVAGADRLSLWDLAARANDDGAEAAPTFGVLWLGDLGILQGQVWLQPPLVAALAVGAPGRCPPTGHPRTVELTLTVNPLAVPVADAAAFLSAFARQLAQLELHIVT